MNVTVVVGENLNWLGIGIFAGLGYLNGYLLRDIGLIKIIAAFFVIPYSLSTLSQVNNVVQATLPFLLLALAGYWGLDKTRYRVSYLFNEVQYHIGYFVRRWR
ncbi:MAG: hypothetical protein HOA22_11055 [Gammaproteobacteria bacterium]|jgi:hypothetical protein|nr:hypothetical protein [Gammaproteobacteria bacterium]HIJ25784.1 hypothetical protein [Gammaproteobacteria bacterium]HIJ29260.1 hypothetical protein [Gammaproteobacteria bacterium]